MFFGAIVLLPALTTDLAAQGKGKGKGKGGAQETAEMFQVSKVGQRYAAETRELLGIVYHKVADDYNQKLKAEAAKKSAAQTFKGEQIRVLRKLQKDNPNGDLYLCAYNGSPSVFQITGQALKGGQLSPPLANIAPAGEHSTQITRTVVDPNAQTGNEPARQKVDANTGGGVTFFGITLDTGSSKPQSQPGTKEITETRTFSKYTADISTEKLEEGPPPMSQQLFLSMVKNGEVFKVKHLENRRCQECRGFGRVPDTRPLGMRGADGKMDCPDCGGKGKIDWNVTYMVGW